MVLFNVKGCKFEQKEYEDVDDAAVYILKKMGIIKKKSDEEEPYLVSEAVVNIDAYYFNMNLQAYEPVLEPWLICWT